MGVTVRELADLVAGKVVGDGDCVITAARALDRGFAGALMALARHVEPRLTPPQGVEQIVGRSARQVGSRE